MRFQKSIKNLIAGWVGQAAYTIIYLFVRKAFINTLGTDMLGISGLLSNVLSFLSLAELGIGSAVSYSLYKPLAKQDIETVQSIMYFFKKAYRLIGIFILIAGTAMLPMLSIIVPEVRNYDNIYVYYELFVINTAISYFYIYKATLIEANQDRHIKILNHYLWVCLLGIAQIIILVCFKNYILFLTIQTIFTLIENICISKKADKLFPYLKENGKRLPERNKLKEIVYNTLGTSINKLGSAMVNATDNILISRFAGLAVTGIFSNYTYITAGMHQIFYQMYSALEAGIGDLNAQSERGSVKRVYKEVLFCGNFIYSLGFVIMINCIVDFNNLWFGEGSDISFTVVCLHLWNIYFMGLRAASITFIQVMGLQWRGKYRRIIEGIFNLAISIILGYKFGLLGVVIGTSVSSMCIGAVLGAHILCKYGFGTNIFFIIGLYIKYGICTLGLAYLSRIINIGIFGASVTIPNLIIKAATSVIIYLVISCILWGRTAEFERFILRIKSLAVRFKKKQ